MNRSIPAALSVLALTGALALAASAQAHQSASSNGATVTVHVLPDDAPAAGRPATVKVVRVAVPKRARFSYRSVRIRVTDSSGRTVANRAGSRSARLTFPRAGAYQITVSGRYSRSGKKRSFTTRFAVRAS
ncbi:hypothetical protein [Patulibacter defluvii]|uniref:hypothetical protein n=1 Tax=Patulibacter defluvii TaxID=3095358 RepID=UPI002A74F181|nr:hypothetical protein [Patulibacter sp. DM4]